MTERRKNTRYDVNWPVRVAHREDGCLYGAVANVSAGGLLFSAPGRLAVGELAEAEIAVNPLFTIRCAVRIVRAGELRTGEWAYGAEFVRLSESDAETVLEALCHIRPAAEDTTLSHRLKGPFAA